jgi:hypothetical protein
MMYRIPHYVKEVKRRLGIFLTLDRVSLLAVVIGAIGMFVLGVLIVKTLFRLVVLVIILVTLGLGGRFWWLHQAMPTAVPRKDEKTR